MLQENEFREVAVQSREEVLHVPVFDSPMSTSRNAEQRQEAAKTSAYAFAAC
jgi:hypothetical protein